MSKEGLFLSFEGGDGVGKKTQHEMLVNRLQEVGETVLQVDFPQYNDHLGGFIKKLQGGIYGVWADQEPIFASSFYALDRATAAPRIREALAAGSIVLANRFSASNMAHQAGKLSTLRERRRIVKWIDNYEHNILKTPRPDFHFILQLPVEIASKRMAEREKADPSRKRDPLEDNPEYLKNSTQTYLELARDYPDRFSVTWCVGDDGEQRTREDIHEEIWSRFEELRAA